LTVLAAHQPNYLPWLGFFDKIARSDIFILTESDIFSPRGFVQRNKVMVNGKPHWLTAPVGKPTNTYIRDLPIRDDLGWRSRHLKTILTAYKSAPYYSTLKDLIEVSYESSRWSTFAPFAESLILDICEYLDVKPRIYVVDSDNLEDCGRDAIVTFCKKYGADTYLSGAGGKEYMGKVPLAEHGIRLEYQDYTDPTGKNLSIIDSIANLGPETRTLITSPCQDCYVKQTKQDVRNGR